MLALKLLKWNFWQASCIFRNKQVHSSSCRHCGELQWQAGPTAALTICLLWNSPESTEWNHSYGACHWAWERQKSAHWESCHPFIFHLEKHPFYLDTFFLAYYSNEGNNSSTSKKNRHIYLIHIWFWLWEIKWHGPGFLKGH